jgi:GNAT superfamily N-acetyltransferase
MNIEVHPLTPDRWDDLVELFGRPGASIPRGCWCMYYRGSGKTYATSREANRNALRELVDRGQVPGLIGYANGRAVGWISLGPREDFARLERSPIAKPVDEKPVWSIVCFFVDARTRGQGITHELLEAAEDYARSQGVTLLEAYPVDRPDRGPAISLWWGAKSIYDRAGFEEVARRKATRPVVRKMLHPEPSSRAT